MQGQDIEELLQRLVPTIVRELSMRNSSSGSNPSTEGVRVRPTTPQGSSTPSSRSPSIVSSVSLSPVATYGYHRTNGHALEETTVVSPQPVYRPLDGGSVLGRYEYLDQNGSVPGPVTIVVPSSPPWSISSSLAHRGSASPPPPPSPPVRRSPSPPASPIQCERGISPPLMPHQSVPSLSYAPSCFVLESPHIPRHAHTPVVVKRHPRYCFDDGTVKIMVESTLFHVHRYFFERDSALFRDVLFNGPGVRSGNAPIRLESCTALEFERFLGVLYPASFLRHEATSLEEWTSILSLATQWGFETIRALARREVFPLASAVDKVVLAHKYDIKEWLVDAYAELCVRQDPLSNEEAERIGATDTARVARLREKRKEGRTGVLDYAALSFLVEVEFGLAAQQTHEEESSEDSDGYSDVPDSEEAENDSCADEGRRAAVHEDFETPAMVPRELASRSWTPMTPSVRTGILTTPSFGTRPFISPFNIRTPPAPPDVNPTAPSTQPSQTASNTPSPCAVPPVGPCTRAWGATEVTFGHTRGLPSVSAGPKALDATQMLGLGHGTKRSKKGKGGSIKEGKEDEKKEKKEKKEKAKKGSKA